MQSRQHIIDNRDNKMSDYLSRNMAFADSLDVVSAYFTIYGYELLEDRLLAMKRVRFLYGDPTSVEDVDPGNKEAKSFEITETGLAPHHSLNQKFLAKRCAKWIGKESVHIRSVSQSKFLHGKMYLTSVDKRTTGGVVGSSNFTKSGLGGSDRPNLEINLATLDSDTLAGLQSWFDDLWDDRQQVDDVKQKVLQALNRMGKDHSPEIIYYKTLYELFRKELEARQAGEDAIETPAFQESQVWQALYRFQRDGALSVIGRLRQHRGCILADSVGLGKTYTALAVIKYFEQHNDRVLVLCPKKLSANWQLYQVANNHSQNPFIQDRFGYTLLAHTDLSRDSGFSDAVDLANFNWSNYDLVVIDESHNFRNEDGMRYKKLMDEIIKSGSRTKVLMLSATPVNTSLIDLRNQIYLMTEGREDSFQESLGVDSIRRTMREAQKSFVEWEEKQKTAAQRDKQELLGQLGASFFRLLGGVSISRSRRQVKTFYKEDMEDIGDFPHQEIPINRYAETDLKGELSYGDLSNILGGLNLSLYQPSGYVTDAGRIKSLEAEKKRHNFNQRDREHYLIAMMRTNLLKRLESSAHSLELTLGRSIRKIDAMLAKIELYKSRMSVEGTSKNYDAISNDEVLPDTDEDDEELIVGRGENPYRLSELNLEAWVRDMGQDRAKLQVMHEQVSQITPERDGKLHQIKDDLREKAHSPGVNLNGDANRKTLVFTTFKDTAIYLYENLRPLADELDLRIAMVSGDETHTVAGRNGYNEILDNFAPVARNRGEAGEDIDILIATDCISEGQNLQDCDRVLNYDIHWNPVRLIQRFGRIDRIGSRNKSVQMVNYWPTKDMDEYLKLESRVQARMAIADIAGSGDEDLFDVEDAPNENELQAGAQLAMDFRDEQLRRIQEEALTMDDLDDVPVMSDFTLDDFIMQILRYLERNREELEAVPLGAYAVTEHAAEVRPNVIFLLKQRNAAKVTHRNNAVSPVHPYYLVCLYEDGDIRYGCTNTRRVLELFERVAAGETTPIKSLCDSFDSETNQGRDMALYNGLVNRAITNSQSAHSRVQTAGLAGRGGRNFLLPERAESPMSAEDFQLVTWLVIKSG